MKIFLTSADAQIYMKDREGNNIYSMSFAAKKTKTFNTEAELIFSDDVGKKRIEKKLPFTPGLKTTVQVGNQNGEVELQVAIHKQRKELSYKIESLEAENQKLKNSLRIAREALSDLKD